ncbi:MAG: response regulator [Bdellovibrionota bacterium]
MKNILIADDEEFIRRLFSKVLEDPAVRSLDVQIHFASNGQEALDVASAHPLDLITMDISMPGKSGIDATREIRANPSRYGKPKIIAVTGVGEKSEAIKAGCDDYLAKPVTNEELLETVLSHLDAARRRLPETEPHGRRVLVIDVDHGSLYWTQKSLRQGGYSPLLSEGFADALRLCKTGMLPNAVLIDCRALAALAADQIRDSEQLLGQVQAAGVPVLLRGDEEGDGPAAVAWVSRAHGRLLRSATSEELLGRLASALK